MLRRTAKTRLGSPAATGFAEGDFGEVWKNTQTAPANSVGSVDSPEPVLACLAGAGLRPAQILPVPWMPKRQGNQTEGLFAEAGQARQRVGADESEQVGEGDRAGLPS